MNPDQIHLLTRALTSLIVPALLGWLIYGARRQALLHPWQEKFVLAYGREMRWLSAIFLIGAVVMVWVASKAKPEDETIATVTAGGFVGMIAVFVIETFRVRVEFAGDHIHCFSPWRSDRTIPWSAVDSIAYSSVLQWWVVTTRGHGTIRLHSYLSGVGDFLATARAAGIKITSPLPAN